MPKDPTRHQVSSGLTYQAQTPAFLLKLQNKIHGIQPDDEDEPQYEEEEFYDDGSGRPPIPTRPRERPPIPERPGEDPGSADEESGDEKPQVVVLRQGKHLTERQAENERRKEKGLAPLPEESVAEDDSTPNKNKRARNKEPAPTLSFSSGSSTKPAKRKRTIIGDTDTAGTSTSTETKKAKKTKKEKKTLLSFGDDA